MGVFVILFESFSINLDGKHDVAVQSHSKSQAGLLINDPNNREAFYHLLTFIALLSTLA